MEAIVAACNQAFGVTTCQCVQHSDGSCDPSLAVEEAIEYSLEPLHELAQDGTRSDDASGSDDRSAAVQPKPSAAPSRELIAEVEVDGRKLEEVGQQITTELEIRFTTNVEVIPYGG